MKPASSLLLTAVLGLAAPLRADMPPTPFKPDGNPDSAYMVPDELNLDYALSFALDNNFAIRQAKERLRQQEGVVLEASARTIPNLAVNSGYTGNGRGLTQSFSATVPVNTRSWSLGVTATQTLFAGGAIRAGLAGAASARSAAVAELQAVVNDALLDVRTRFYAVLVSRERIKVQEQNVELLRHQFQDVKSRYEAGTVSNFEVLRAEVALANAQPPLISARNNHRLAVEDLRQALGFTTHDPATLRKIPEFVGTLDYAPLPLPLDLAAAVAAARAQRPELQRLAQLVAARSQDVRRQRAGYLPTLSLSGGYQLRNAPYAFTPSGLRVGTNRLNDALGDWTFGLQGSWAVFDGRATTGRLRQARSSLAQAELSLTQAQLAIDVEVRRACLQYQEATELAEASKKVVEQAEEAVRLADARYSAGTATQLDVLQARTDLTTARLNQLQAYYSFNVANANLRRATGLPDALVAGR
ncbi:MAG: TolC family protein [Opitutus sp.]|nr:TolC family protein [Opitutus sp.]